MEGEKNREEQKKTCGHLSNLSFDNSVISSRKLHKCTFLSEVSYFLYPIVKPLSYIVDFGSILVPGLFPAAYKVKQ